MIHDDEIRSLVAQLDTKDNAAREAVWQELRSVGDRVLPYFEEFFCKAKRLEARRDIAFHSIRYARESDLAFRIGLLALVEDQLLYGTAVVVSLHTPFGKMLFRISSRW